MSELFPVAGMKIYIGGAPIASQAADFVAGDFSLVTWTEIDGWETCGNFGDEATVIRTDLINRGRTTKQKGTRDAGSMENRFAVLSSDAGQTAVIAASLVPDNYPFRIVMDDTPPGGSTPSERLFIGLVASAREVGGAANTVRMLAVNIEINSNIVTVAAT